MSEPGRPWPYDEEALLKATMRRADGLAAGRRRRRAALRFAELGVVALVVIVSIFVITAPGLHRPHHVPSTGPTTSTSVPSIAERCPQKTARSDDLVDEKTGERFAPIRFICESSSKAGSGLIAGGFLYVEEQVVGHDQNQGRVVRVNLRGSGAIASPTLDDPLGPVLMAQGRLWVLGTLSSSIRTVNFLYELSPTTLSIEHRFDIASQLVAPAAGRLWVATGTGVAAIDPGKGELTPVHIGGMPSGAAILGLAGTGSTLYLYVQGGRAGFAGALLRFVPGVGLTADVPAGGYVQSLVGVGDGVLWVYTAGGSFHGVRSYSTTTLQPLANGFGDSAPNGTWTSQLSPVAFWFEQAGYPIACASPRTGVLLTNLKLPSSWLGGRQLAPAPYVAAGEGYLVLGAHLTSGFQWSELAVFPLDPRCVG